MTRFLLSLVTLCAVLPALCLAQDDVTKTKPPVEIPDEPRIVDPIQFMPEPLRKKVSVDFNNAPLSSFFDWLNENAGLPVIIDSTSLEAANIRPTNTFSLHADDSPLYMVLSRLNQGIKSRLAWKADDGILFLTTTEVAKVALEVRPYNVADLIDAGYEMGTLVQLAQDFATGPWMDIDGVGGTISTLGDVLFVNQTPREHLDVAAILQGLKEHGRETRLLVSAEQLALENRLESETIAFNFDEQRLDHTIQVLQEQTGLEILVDWNQIKKSLGSNFDERTFVTLKVPETKLATAFKALLQPYRLVAVVEGSTVQIISQPDSEGQLFVAVYDVRDLCRDVGESMALIQALQDQVSEAWFNIDGSGGDINAPVTGTLIVRQTDEGLRQVRTLLATYREALLNSKPRELTKPVDLDEQVTRYYRLETSVALGLEKLLPQLVSPESWKSDTNPEGGTILVVSGGTDVVDPSGNKVIAAYGNTNPNTPSTPALAVLKSVMIIHQSRKVHVEIGKVISRIQNGDLPWMTDEQAKQPEWEYLLSPHGFYGGGGMGGGFGGGGMGGMGGGSPPPPAPAAGGFGGGYF